MLHSIDSPHSTVSGGQGPGRSTDQNSVGLHWNIGRWDEAKELFLQVIKTRKAVLGVEHPDTLTSMASLAITWKAMGRQEEAVKWMNVYS